MAYITNYSLQVKTTKPKTYSRKKLIIIGFLIFAFGLGACFPGAAKKVRSVVFPFLEPNVQEAFSSMLEDLDRGEPISDAASVFCREIIFGEAN